MTLRNQSSLGSTRLRMARNDCALECALFAETIRNLPEGNEHVGGGSDRGKSDFSTRNLPPVDGISQGSGGAYGI